MYGFLPRAEISPCLFEHLRLRIRHSNVHHDRLVYMALNTFSPKLNPILQQSHVIKLFGLNAISPHHLDQTFCAFSDRCRLYSHFSSMCAYHSIFVSFGRHSIYSVRDFILFLAMCVAGKRAALGGKDSPSDRY